MNRIKLLEYVADGKTFTSQESAALDIESRLDALFNRLPEGWKW